MAITKVTSGLISADAASVDLNIDAGTLYIDATNNRVGVGNTSPSVALDVTGAVTLSGTLTASSLIYPTSDGTSGQALVTDGSGNLSFSTIQGYTDSDVESYLDGGTSTPTFASATVSGDLTVDTSTLKVDSSNNRVGIGTASPEIALHIDISDSTVYSSSFTGSSTYTPSQTPNALQLRNTYTAQAGNQVGLWFETTGAGNTGNERAGRIVFVNNSSVNYGGDFAFQLRGGGAAMAERMRITAAGDVGIGETSPDTALDVVGGSADSVVNTLTLKNDSTGNSAGTAINFVVDGVNDIVSSQIIGQRTGSAYHQGSLQFLTRDSSGSGLLERMRIDASGTLTTPSGTDFNIMSASGMTLGSTTSVVVFKTNNTEKARIDTSGNFQMGASPVTVIDSSRNLTNIGTISSGAITTSTKITQTNSGELLRNSISNWGGNSEHTILHNGWNSSISDYLIVKNSGNGTVDGAIVIADNVFAYGGHQATGGAAASLTAPLSSTNAFTVTSSGNANFAGSVTAGGTIYATQSANDVLLRAGTTGAGAYVRLDSGTSGYYGIQMTAGDPLAYKWFIGSYGTNDFTIKSAPTGTEFLRVTTGGNVGIGTGANPDEKLHVVGQASFQNAGNTNRGNILMGPHGNGTSKWSTLGGTHYNDATGSGNGSGNAGCMIIGCHSQSSSNEVYVGGGPYELNPATALKFYTHSATTHNLGGTERMRINSSGQVSINDTTDPDNSAEMLQVRGTNNAVAPIVLRNASGDQSAYRMIHYYKKEETSPIAITALDVTGSSVTHSYLSDERLKDELGSADGLNLISELNPIKFRFKDGTGTGSQGFTAQGFKQAFDNVGSFPRGVTVPDNPDEYWHLDDKVLIPNLVKAIQELKEENDNLKARIEVIENG